MFNLTWQQLTLLIAPWPLLASTAACYRALQRRLGAPRAYLLGFCFYWLFWCAALPLVLLGPQGVARLFWAVANPFGQPWWLGAFCLLGPPLVSLLAVFPRAVRRTTWQIVAVSAALALVNGTLEELLWRGTFIALFPQSLLLGQVYAAAGFALWHLAPQTIYPSRGPGGRWGLVAGTLFLGLLWSWVAGSTGTILYLAVAHIVVDFSALGWDVLFEG